MSKLETPLTRRYWEKVGGTLVEEFPAVKRSKTNAQRLIDAVIILGEEKKMSKAADVEIEGKNIVVVQTKATRIGMYLAGQAHFSAMLMERHRPASIQTVAICTKGDSVLEPLLETLGIKVFVYDP